MVTALMEKSHFSQFSISSSLLSGCNSNFQNPHFSKFVNNMKLTLIHLVIFGVGENLGELF